MTEEVLGLLRPDLRDLVPYEVPHYPGYIKLDANENPYPLAPEVLAEVCRRLSGESFNRYPDPLATALRGKLAEYTGLAPENILAGNGSDELILNLFLAFGSGGRIIITPPTFAMYEIHARIAGAVPVMVARREDFSLDLPALIREAQNPATRITVICSPNNPTGNIVPREVVEAVVAATGGLVLLDEAYAEFAGESYCDLINRCPRLVVLRTFSKAFGLAGLRVGYLLADPAVITALLRVKQPFNLNSFSQLVAVTVLEYLPLFERRVGEIVASREELYRRLKAVRGVEVFPSRANFILFRTPLPAQKVYEGLLARRVLIRNVAGPGLEQCLRVTVGRPAENEAFVEALKEVVEGCAENG